jgi:hypothetical protein
MYGIGIDVEPAEVSRTVTRYGSEHTDPDRKKREKVLIPSLARILHKIPRHP